MPDDQRGQPAELDLPKGVRRLTTLGPVAANLGRVAWSPDGTLIAAPGDDGVVVIWDVATREVVHALDSGMRTFAVAFDSSGRTLASVGQYAALVLWDAHSGAMKHDLGGATAVAFPPTGKTLATAEDDDVVRLWRIGDDIALVHELDADSHQVSSLAFDHDGRLLATGGREGAVHIWDVASATVTRSLYDHTGSVMALAYHPSGTLASAGGEDHTVKLWDSRTGRLIITLESHTDAVVAVSFVADGRLLASEDEGGCIWLWDPATGGPVGRLSGTGVTMSSDGPAPAFHPSLPWLAYVTEHPEPAARGIEIVEIDIDVLLGELRPASVKYTSAKIVLVGDSGVGKTGLGWRMAHGEFIEHASTHGQQFWLLDDLGTIRADGAHCEAVLWDLAGQPDYRLIHALFLDDADLVLLLFDPTRDDDPLRAVEYWLRQLAIGLDTTSGPDALVSATVAILVAARADRGTPRMTSSDIRNFCKERGILSFVATSAASGDGLDQLLAEMRRAIAWEARPTTVTTQTFKQIKDYVLGLKEQAAAARVILSPDALRRRLERDEIAVGFSDHEMLSAVGHLSNHGYVTRLRTSSGQTRILLAPELLNNVASSIVLEARRNPKGLGSLEEQRVVSGDYDFPELNGLSQSDQEVLLDSAVAMFLARNVCFRQTDPLTSRVYLVFPDLINLQKPTSESEPATEDGATYDAVGAVENLYASLVVLLGYTATFTRTNQWRDHASYVVGDGLVCGFRVDAEREGGVSFVLFFGEKVGGPIRTLFQSLFESFLARHSLVVHRYDAVLCPNDHQLHQAVVREQIAKGNHRVFCVECGARVALPPRDTPIVLTQEEATDLRKERRETAKRSRLEQAAFRLNGYAMQEGVTSPTCFVSYAWGNHEHEHWVEALATDMMKAGIVVILDRWENARVGASVPRFIERLARADRVIVVGTPQYRVKYENREPMRGFVAAAEGDLIGARMLGAEDEKSSVLPVLLEGTPRESLPALLQARVYADFRDPFRYVPRFIGLVSSLYEISAQHPIYRELERLLGPHDVPRPPT